MVPIKKKIVTDESNRPIAVQIDYADWLEIERRLGADRNGSHPVDLQQFAGTLRLSEDPVEYQRRVRGAWPFYHKGQPR